MGGRVRDGVGIHGPVGWPRCAETGSNGEYEEAEAPCGPQSVWRQNGGAIAAAQGRVDEIVAKIDPDTPNQGQER